MKIKKGFVLRVVGGENVVVPVGAMSKVFHGMINLNETGAFMWKFFTEDHTLEEGVAALCAEYEVEEEEDSCCGFYGDCIEDNGILDYLGDLEFAEE